MQDWILGLIAWAISPVRQIVQATIDRFTALWATLTGFFGRSRDRFANLVTFGRRWADAQAANAAATYTTARWFAFSFVPRSIAEATTNIVSWAIAVIVAYYQLGVAELALLRAWIISNINDVIAVLLALRDWTFAEVDYLRQAVGRLIDRVFGVLGTPERLAAWAVEAIAVALLRLALANAVPIGRALWASRVTVALESAQRIEDIASQII